MQSWVTVVTQKRRHAHCCRDSWWQEWEAAGWTASTAMTQNRQGWTVTPQGLPPVSHFLQKGSTMQQPSKTATHTGHQLFQQILHSNHYTMSPELKHVSTQTSSVLCNYWWHFTKGQSISHQIALSEHTPLGKRSWELTHHQIDSDGLWRHHNDGFLHETVKSISHNALIFESVWALFESCFKQKNLNYLETIINLTDTDWRVKIFMNTFSQNAGIILLREGVIF